MAENTGSTPESTPTSPKASGTGVNSSSWWNPDPDPVKWFGYKKEDMKPEWKEAAVTFTAPGGSAEKKLGKIKTVTINEHPGKDPVHKSSYNPLDKRDCLSATIEGERRTRTCHIFEDGCGTTNKYERPS